MSPHSSQKPLRVAQWATGSVGTYSLRAVIEHPGMELVAVRVYSESKEGKDAGDLCKRPATGVKATRDLEAVLAAKPDCVLYMPESTDMADVCRLLESGVNVVTTRPEFFNPAMMEPALRERIETACRKGDSSIHSTGSSPGFITEALPIVLSSLVRRLDFLGIDEFADCLAGCSEEMLTTLMGFGETPEDFAKRDVGARDEVFEHSLGLVASAFGLPIDQFEIGVEVSLCSQDTKLHSRTIPAGSVGAQRVSVTGMHKGKPLLQFRSNWFVTMNLEPAWDLRSDGWRVSMQGDAPVEMTINLPMPQEEGMAASARYTAHRPVNAVPLVCAAPAGIVPTTMLPQVIARLG